MYLQESSCIYTSGSHNCILNGLFNKCVSYIGSIVSYGVGMVILSDELVRTCEVVVMACFRVFVGEG